MHNGQAALMVTLAAALAAGNVQAQSPSQGGGRIYCWKNKSGKTECGDSVPLEYQDAAIRELNRRGITVRRSEAALTPEQKKLQQAELERKQAEELKREEQRRRDKALLDTFSNESEIELKRAREIQALESNIKTLQSNLKNANERLADSRARAADYKKRNAAVPQPILDDIARGDSDKARIEKQIAQKRRDMVTLNREFDELKKRFNELKGESSGAPPTAAPAAQPAKK